MKKRSILASLICVVALGATTLPGLAGDKSASSAQAADELPGEWPKLVSRVEPLYPASLRAEKIQGEVLVAFVVTSRGETTAVRAVSSTHPDFEAPAVEAVSQWTFTPGVKGGRPVNTRMEVPVRFELKPEPVKR